MSAPRTTVGRALADELWRRWKINATEDIRAIESEAEAALPVPALSKDEVRREHDRMAAAFGYPASEAECVADGSHSDDLSHAAELRDRTGRHAPAALPVPALTSGPRNLTAEEAVEKALLHTFQLSGKDYRAMQAALSEVAFIRALEQDGFTVAALPVPAPSEQMVTCAICGDYSAKGVEVHEVCLEMLSKVASGVALPVPALDALRGLVNALNRESISNTMTKQAYRKHVLRRLDDFIGGEGAAQSAPSGATVIGPTAGRVPTLAAALPAPASSDGGWESYKDAFPAGKNISEGLPVPALDALPMIFDLAREALAQRDSYAAKGYVMEPLPHEAAVRAALGEDVK